MDIILRAATIYVFLFILFRATGKRSLAQITTFDLILLLIISEVTQQAMIGDDFSITASALAILTLVSLDLLTTLLKQHVPKIAPWFEDGPLILVENGQAIQRRLDKSRIDAADILEAAREKQGLERMEQIKYAVLEKTGSISIVPASQD